MNYTIVFYGDLLVACVPQGADIDGPIREISKHTGTDIGKNIRIIHEITLTDEPLVGDEIVYIGSDFGFLSDESGNQYKYAVKRAIYHDDGAIHGRRTRYFRNATCGGVEWVYAEDYANGDTHWRMYHTPPGTTIEKLRANGAMLSRRP